MVKTIYGTLWYVLKQNIHGLMIGYVYQAKSGSLRPPSYIEHFANESLPWEGYTQYTNVD